MLIPSPREYPTYDLIPEMSAFKIKDELVRRIRTGTYDMIVCNFANCDMVGHTGVMSAAIQAVECVDRCLGEVVAAAQEMGYTLLVTADHGNADRMVEPDGSPNTAHTTNLVPLVLVGSDLPFRYRTHHARTHAHRAQTRNDRREPYRKIIKEYEHEGLF